MASSLLVVFALVVGLVVVKALQADGRERSRTETNDGGAWLVRRRTGDVAHLNYAVREQTAQLNAATAGSPFDIEQAPGIAVTYEPTSGLVKLIDPVSETVLNDITIGQDMQVFAAPDEVFVVAAGSLAVWILTRQDILDLDSLEGVDPVLQSGGGQSAAAVRPDGVSAFYDGKADRVVFRAVDGSTAKSPVIGHPDDIVAMTLIGDTAIILDQTNDMYFVTKDRATARPAAALATETSSSPTAPDATTLVLQQPAPSGDSVVVATPGGSVFDVPFDPDAAVEPVAALEASDPVPPILYGGCHFAVATNPARYVQQCGDQQVEATDLQGFGQNLRLMLVNGWIWINDLDSGDVNMAQPHETMTRVDDLGQVPQVASEDVTDDSINPNSPTEIEVERPNDVTAIETEADYLDNNGRNDPPVARNDNVGTRVDRPVQVNALLNDHDPDGDVLVIDSWEILNAPEGTRVDATTAHDALLVTPAPGATGLVEINYTISDGHGLTDNAVINLEVKENRPDDNQAPFTTNDLLNTRANQRSSVNVLANDLDPDGDLLTLVSVVPVTEGSAGTVAFEPAGLVEFNPDPNAPERIELEYVVADELGAASTGTVNVNVRRADTNNEPDARKDSVVVEEGHAALAKVLVNDRDPDNDPLFVAGAPELVEAPNNDAGVRYTLAELNVTLTPDGEFFFTPPVAGTYLFSYRASDGAESDEALIRVEATPAGDNRPPAAIRDTVTIPAGSTATIFPLQNDSDPDGDVVSLVGHSPTPYADIQVVDGVGLTLQVHPDAPPAISFQYAITDGYSESVSGSVLVSVVDPSSVNQAPVTRPDVVEARPGTTIHVPVIVNDFDPEGTALTVSQATATDGIVAEVGPTKQSVDITLPETVRQSFNVSYDVVDADGNSASATVRVRVVPPDQPNRSPIPRLDIGRARAAIDLKIPVLDNDSDPDGDQLYIESIDTQPSQGMATVSPDGTIVYRALPTARGGDQFTYVVVDGQGGRSIGIVTLGVVAADEVNRPPDAVGDEFGIVIGSTAQTLDSTSNDTDPDGDELTITSVTGASVGRAEVVDGELTYTPPTNVPPGTDVVIKYTVDDGRGGTDDAAVTIKLVEATEPAPPIAVDDRVGPTSAGSTIVAVPRNNDLDPDGNPGALVVSSDDPSATVNDDGTISIVAGEQSSTVEYTVTDPDGLSDTGVISVLVADNTPPVVAEPISVTTPFNTPSQPVDLASHVTDPDGDPMTYVLGESTIGGQPANPGGDGFLAVFTPDAEFAGEAAFSFIADDGQGHRVAVPVLVNVEPPPNRPPTAIGGTFDIKPDGTPLTIDLTKFASDPDPGESLTFALTPTGGSVAFTLDGSTVTAVADPTIAGTTATADYTVTDSQGNAVSATLTVNVGEIDAPPPAAGNDATNLNAGQSVVVNVLANDVDPFGQGLVIDQLDAGDASDAGVSASDSGGGNVTLTAGRLANGDKTIRYTVRDAAGRTASATISVSVAGLPGPPTNLSATASSHQVVLTWAAPPANGAPITGYEIANAANPGAIITTTAASSVTLTGLQNGVEVSFVVRAVNAVGPGDFSAQSAAVIPDEPPGRPAPPTVTAGDGRLIVSWTPPANDGSPISNYVLRISGGDARDVGAGTSFTWEGLTNGTNYTFEVQAVNRQGPGEFSAPSNPEHPYTIPGAPSGVNGVRQNGAAQITWTAPDNGGDPIDYYEIEHDQGGTNTTSGTSLTWSQLTNGQTYRFRARAHNRAGLGPWSDYSAGVVPCGEPTQPPQPHAVRADGAATITWSAPDAQGCAINGYTIRASSGQSISAGGGATSATFSGLSNGTSYTFTVVATNEVGPSVASPPSNAVVPAGLPPATSITAARPDVRKVAVQWSASSANGGLDFHYELQANGSTTYTGGDTSYTFAAADSTTYNFRVRACNDVGCSAWSAAKSATTPGVPNAPNVSADGRDHAVFFSWNTPANNGSDISRFEVSVNGGGWNGQQGTSISVDANPGQSVTVRVRACNAVGCGAAGSATASANNPPQPKVVLSQGAQVNLPGCESQYCHWLRVEASNFQPGRTYTVTCHSARAGAGTWHSYSVTMDGSGNSTSRGCVWGYHEAVWVSIGGVESNRVSW